MIFALIYVLDFILLNTCDNLYKKTINQIIKN